MSKQFFVVASILIMSLSVSALSGSCKLGEKPPFHLNTVSPDRTYEVVLDEQAVISSDPLLTKHEHHEVRFAVFQNGRPTLEGESLYSGGTYDERFPDLFPQHEWVSDSVLRFGQADNSPNRDEVAVYNETDRPLSYLIVRAGKYETLLLLDLRPKSAVKLFVKPQTDQHDDFSYVSSRGTFSGGGNIPEVGKNFRIHSKYVGAAHYEIHIKDGTVLITSQEFEPV